MSVIKSQEDITEIRKSSLLVSKTLSEVAKVLKPGVTGLEIDELAESVIRDHGCEPAFKGYHDFPNTLCVSPNAAVVHGIPSNEPFKEGDVISVDCGVVMNGFVGDSAYSFVIGEVKEDVMKLLQVTREALFLAIENAIVGKRIGDIGFAVQNYAERVHKYGVVRELVGHGVGYSIHEEPEVPNFGKRGQGIKLKENMVIAIEPMINLGKKDVITAEDGWTILAKDGMVSGHFEHTVAVKKEQADILTSFEIIDEAVKSNENLSLVAS